MINRIIDRTDIKIDRPSDIYNKPSFSNHPSLSGLKNVWVRSFPSSSGILKGSFLMLSYKFCGEKKQYVNAYSIII